eukprot:11222048-Lingulodinium_polyedra.AAC.1
MISLGVASSHARAAFVGVAKGSAPEVAKRVTPVHLSCRSNFLERTPSSLARELAVALRARGDRPATDVIK